MKITTTGPGSIPSQGIDPYYLKERFWLQRGRKATSQYLYTLTAKKNGSLALNELLKHPDTSYTLHILPEIMQSLTQSLWGVCKLISAQGEWVIVT